MSNPKAWPGVRTFEVIEPTIEEELEKLSLCLLDYEKEISRYDRRRIESYLYRLRTNRQAMKAITSQGRGRPRDSNALDIALDYLIHKELLGKAAAARADVAAAWSVSEATVKDAFTDHKASATFRLEKMVRSHQGRHARWRRNGQWQDREMTRDDVIEDAAREIREWHKLVPCRSGWKK